MTQPWFVSSWHQSDMFIDLIGFSKPPRTVGFWASLDAQPKNNCVCHCFPVIFHKSISQCSDFPNSSASPPSLQVALLLHFYRIPRWQHRRGRCGCRWQHRRRVRCGVHPAAAGDSARPRAAAHGPGHGRGGGQGHGGWEEAGRKKAGTGEPRSDWRCSLGMDGNGISKINI